MLYPWNLTRLMHKRYALFLLLPLLIAGIQSGCKKEGGGDAATDYSGPITFNKQIAPIVFEQCAPCHRPGQTAPFPLLTYADVKKRAKQIAEVTQTRYMPIWLPETGHQQYVDQRVLYDDQIAAIQKWAKDGAPEGDPKDLPPPPQFVEGWQLGKPDLVLTMPEAYTLPSSGKDVYRNFVIPVDLPADKYVNAMEFRPENKSVHHTFIYLDSSSAGKNKDAEDKEIGFPGMELPGGIESPEGFFLSWQPGKVAHREADGLGWTLKKGSDLILQMHMQVSGKPEKVRPQIGLYFMDTPPTQQPMKIGLSSIDIDIPAGEKNYKISDTFEVPVDVRVMAIAPHSHYLGRELRGIAQLPDGTTQTLLRIPQWDFNWQGDYRFVTPVFLPEGTKLTMDYIYDNSKENVHNPHQPPRRVKYGPNTTDEMAELHFQLLTPAPNDREALAKAFAAKAQARAIDYYRGQLKLNPNDSKIHTLLGKAYFFQRQHDEALKEYQKAISLNPKNDEAYYLMGVLYRTKDQLPMAGQAFQRAVQLNPKNAEAYGNLGLIHLQMNRMGPAEAAFKKALEINPNDEIARNSLRDIQKARSGG